MAAPQGEYSPEDGYGQAPVNPELPPDPSTAAQQAHAAGKKKRVYAGEAFDYGSGANAALGGQQQGGGDYNAYAAQAAAAGYPPAGWSPAAGAAEFGQAPVPGQPQPGVGEYQPPAAAYPGPTGGVAQVTQQFGQMGMSGPQTPSQIPQYTPQAPKQIPLNQLYPTDLLAQPFSVVELGYAPPRIILPPNVSGIRLSYFARRC
jgi:protein transport protein SEC24